MTMMAFLLLSYIEYDKEMIVYEISDDINHIKMHGDFTEMTERKTGNSFFSQIFFEQGYLT